VTDGRPIDKSRCSTAERGKKHNNNFALRKTLARLLRLRRRRHNGRWLWITGTDHSSRFITVATPPARRRSCSVYNSCGLMPSRMGGHILFETTKCLPMGRLGGPECGNRISDANFLIVFHSNSGSILLSFRDMIAGRTTDRRRQPLRRASNNTGPVWLVKLYCHDNHCKVLTYRHDCKVWWRSFVFSSLCIAL